MYKYDFSVEVPITFKKKGEAFNPILWVAENKADVNMLSKQRVPFIKFGGDKNVLTKLIIYPFLMSKFPGIKWNEVLDLTGRKKAVDIVVPGGYEEVSGDLDYDREDTEFSDRASSERTFDGSFSNVTSNINIADYFGDTENVVDMEKLSNMNLLPKFLDKIVNAVSVKADDVHWQDGYNKKLGYCLGNYVDDSQADNLLIIDVSASIPRAVSATMLALADQMREQMKADIIITGAKSRFWAYGDELPDPKTLRRLIPPSNESDMFRKILVNNVFNRTWDNVVAFGDNDCPYIDCALKYSETTRIGKLYSFRVPWDMRNPYARDTERPVGYSLWVDKVSSDHEYEGDQSWILDINTRYKE